MKLSTSTWLHATKKDDGTPYTYAEVMADLKQAGYDSVDVNLWPLCYPGQPLAGDNWEQTVEQLVAATAAADLPVYQTHGNTMSGTEWDDPQNPHRELQHVTTLRCVEAARRLGANCMVMHPFNLAHTPLYSAAENKRRASPTSPRTSRQPKRQGFASPLKI